MPYIKWEGKVICAKRMNLKYFDLIIKTNSTSCPSGTRSCGKIDSLNNSLCLENSQPECPINLIKIDNVAKNFPDSYKYILLNNNKKLVFSTNNIEGIINEEFKISQGQPCSNPYYQNYINQTYLLDPFQRRDKCMDPITNSLFDTRYTKLDQIKNFTKILEDNGITNLLKSDNYQMNFTDYNNSLYMRPYIGIKEQCLSFFKNFNKSGNLIDLKSIKSKIEYSINFSQKIMIFIVFSSLITGFGTVIYLLIICSSNKYFESPTGHYVFKGLSCLLFLALLCIFIYQIIKINSVPDIFVELINSKLRDCGDPYTNFAFESLNSSISSSNSKSMVCILLCLGSEIALSFLIYFIYQNSLKIEIEESHYLN